MTLMVVVEGDTDLPFIRKLAADAGLEIAAEIDARGKGNIDRDLPRYNDAAKGSPWLVVRDLDTDAECAPEYVAGLSFRKSRWMCFRVAVREVEAWALADTKGIASFLGVEERLVPANPDAEKDPTMSLVSLARRGRRGGVRRGFVPAQGSSTQVGPAYEALLISFGERHWNLDRASRRSTSLCRARAALRDLATRWTLHAG